MLLSAANVLQRGLGVHTSHDPKNPWKLPKGPCCQAPPNITPDRWEAWDWDLQDRGKGQAITRQLLPHWMRLIPMQTSIF